MAFGRMGTVALLGSLYCAASWLSACAQRTFVGDEPTDAFVGGAVAEQDAGSNGADNGKASGTNGATSGGSTSDGNSAAQDGGEGTLSNDASAEADASTLVCEPGTSPCGDSCVDLMSSALNCGRCGRTCPAGQACSGMGTCLAPAGCTAKSLGTHDYFFCTSTKQWGQARADCKAWGMDLAIVETAEENAFLATFQTAWLGYNDLDRENSFLWVAPGAGNSGASASYQNWAANQPDNHRSCTLGVFCTGPDEGCVQMYDEGNWNDAKCNSSLAYVCESY